jgi:hypothetical protein
MWIVSMYEPFLIYIPKYQLLVFQNSPILYEWPVWVITVEKQITEECLLGTLKRKQEYSIKMDFKIKFFLSGIVGGWSPIGSTQHCGH